MTVQNVLSLENLVDVQAVLDAATRRLTELKNNLPTFPEVKKQANQLRRDIKSYLNKNGYYSFEAGQYYLETNEDKSRRYSTHFFMVPVDEKGETRWEERLDGQTTKEILESLIPEGWRVEVSESYWVNDSKFNVNIQVSKEDLANYKENQITTSYSVSAISPNFFK